MSDSESAMPESWMRRALTLAQQGTGYVEPNPQVGCVIVKNGQPIGQGYHQTFGGDHAEIVALKSCSQSPSGATVYVTLEPCSHFGKTPPCCHALIDAGVSRVVIAEQDPFAEVDGQGIAALRAAGIEVEVGLLAEEAKRLTAPYRKRLTQGRPWVIAKWAMTLDGKLATNQGDSQWISNETSRAKVHQLRGRVDAIMVGAETAIHDDPLLNARPAGPRVATRIVVDSLLRTPETSQLAKTAAEIPTLLVTSGHADQEVTKRFEQAGCEVLVLQGQTHLQRLDELLQELGNRQMTNLLVEGGGKLLGSLLELKQMDEVHVFVAPKIAGGADAVSPVGGLGCAAMADALKLQRVHHEILDGDIYLRGELQKEPTV